MSTQHSNYVSFYLFIFWPFRKRMASVAAANNGACLVEETFHSLERYRKLETNLSRTGVYLSFNFHRLMTCEECGPSERTIWRLASNVCWSGRQTLIHICRSKLMPKSGLDWWTWHTKYWFPRTLFEIASDVCIPLTLDLATKNWVFWDYT